MDELESSAVQQHGSIWDRSLSLSDTDIMDDMIARVQVSPLEALSSDDVYKAFVEAKKVSDEWMKYYFVAIALLLISASNATEKISLIGVDFKDSYISVAAVLAFSTSTLVFTNHERKMRLFRQFFQRQLSAVSRPARAEILLRYPLAFYGTEYWPLSARPEGVMIGWSQVLGSLPVILAAASAWLIISPGLSVLLFVCCDKLYHRSDLPIWVKAFTLAVLAISLLSSFQLLRDSKKKHTYTR